MAHKVTLGDGLSTQLYMPAGFQINFYISMCPLSLMHSAFDFKNMHCHLYV
jgi:hypothetical protein